MSLKQKSLEILLEKIKKFFDFIECEISVEYP